MRFLLGLLLALHVAAAPLSEDAKVQHALDRLTFGARSCDVDQIQRMGIKQWIDLHLHPEKITENPVLEAKLKPLESLRLSAENLAKDYGKSGVITELAAGKLYRAIYSNRQLAEVLADFWFNHFNVSQQKGAARYLVTAYERDTIRPHILGKFKDMLLATAESPAMLVYLDNVRSVDPRMAQMGKGKKRGLNENYGRELMELHTLGVDGGYTQKDVTEVARCFTGWTVRQPRQGGDFAFNRRMHDNGEKVVLGVRIPAGGGIEDGRKVLDILAKHPSTAQFISRKLAIRFVSDEPSAALVDRMAKVFTKSGGDIREVMAAMLESPEFWSEKNYHSKLKSPLELVASAVRALAADVESADTLAKRVAEAGQPLYRKQEPTGYSNSSEEWVSTAALLARMNFGVALAENRIAGVTAPEAAKATELRLGGPEFQRK